MSKTKVKRDKEDHPWLKSYPKKIEWDQDFEVSAMSDLLDDSAAKYGDNVYLDFLGKEYTYREMKEMVHNWIESVGNGYRLFPSKEVASNSVTALQTPPGTKKGDLEPLRLKLRSEKFVLSTGLPPMNDALEAKGEGVIIRIPHMGDMTKDMLNEYLAAMKKYILEA